MLDISLSHRRSTLCSGVTRRDFIRVGSLAPLGLSLTNLLSWEKAVAAHYEFDTVDNLQVKWIDSLRKPPADLASRSKLSGGGSTASLSKGRDELRGYDQRTSAGPALPQLEPPILGTARGSTPREDDRAAPSKGQPTTRPTYSSPPNMLLLPPDLPKQ